MEQWKHSAIFSFERGGARGTVCLDESVGEDDMFEEDGNGLVEHKKDLCVKIGEGELTCETIPFCINNRIFEEYTAFIFVHSIKCYLRLTSFSFNNFNLELIGCPQTIDDQNF